MEAKAADQIFTFNFAALFGAAFLIFFALDFFIPVLPFYVVERGGSEEAVGLLMGIFTFFSVILRPFQGRRADRAGRKKLLLLGIAAYALAGLGLTALPSVRLLFVIRALQGIGWGAFLLAFNTMAIDLAPPARRGEVVGLMGIAPPLSLAAAPLLGEVLRGKSGSYTLLFAVSVAAALAALLLAALIKEPPPEKAAAAGGRPLLSRKVLLPSLMIFFVTFTFGGIITFLPLLGRERGIPAVGAFFTVFALTAMVVRPLTGRLSDRWGRPFVFLPGLAILSLSLVTIALAGTAGRLLLGGFLFGCGMGAANPSIMALAADRLALGERGVGMATYTAAFDLGIVAGSILLGFFLAWLNFFHLFLICAAAALLPLAIYAARVKYNARAVE
jgi:MFS family permease